MATHYAESNVEPYQVQSIVESLIIAGAFVSALGILSWTWVKTRAAKYGAVETAKLAESVGLLHDRVDSLQEELGYAHERLDFAERVLTRIADDGAPRELPKH